VDSIRSLCRSLFLLVVDLSKPVGNTAIHYFLSMRHSSIVLCYCFNASMPNRGKISVEAPMYGGCHVFLHNTEDTEKAVLWLVVLRSQLYFWLTNINFRYYIHADPWRDLQRSIVRSTNAVNENREQVQGSSFN
jgi:hypothetical protein